MLISETVAVVWPAALDCEYYYNEMVTPVTPIHVYLQSFSLLLLVRIVIMNKHGIYTIYIFVQYNTVLCLSSSHLYTLFIFYIFDMIGCLHKSYFRGTFFWLNVAELNQTP